MTANTAASRKAKGRKLERYIADRYVQEGLYPSARPMPMSGSLKEMPGDIWVDGYSPWIEECKAQELMKIWEWLSQAEAQAGELGKKPLLHFKRNRSEVYTVMRFDDFVEMRKQIKGGADK